MTSEAAPAGAPTASSSETVAVAAARRRTLRPVLCRALVPAAAAVVYVALAVIMFASTWRSPLTNAITHPGGDTQLFIWAMGWTPYALTHGVNPFFSDHVAYPHGVNLLWNMTVPALSLALWPVTAAFGPLLSYNVGATLALALSGTAPATTSWPSAAIGLIQRVLAIPAKRCDRADISFLSTDEVDALLATPDRSTWIGRRDHVLLLVAVQTGLSVSELIGLTRGALELGGAPPYVRCYGKGRKNRATPLTSHAVAVLKVWLQEQGGAVEDPLFPSRRGTRLSRDAVEFLLAKYVTSAKERCPSLRPKNVTAHVLHHTAAMLLRQAGVDTTAIALWLGACRSPIGKELSMRRRRSPNR